MRIFSFLPIVISSLLAAAHFYRSGFLLVAAMSLFLPLLMIVRHRFVPRLLTFFLLLCGMEWLRTLYVLAGRYQEASLSTTRLIVILVTVSLITILSPLVFRTSAMRRRYQPEQATER